MSDTEIPTKKPKKELTAQQLAEIDRNRQLAIERRNARLASIPISKL